PLFGEAFGVELEGHAVRDAAVQQAGVRDHAGLRSVEVSNQRALWIGRDRCDRAGTRSEAEPMQCKCRSTGVERHDVISFEFEFLPRGFVSFVKHATPFADSSV